MVEAVENQQREVDKLWAAYTGLTTIGKLAFGETPLIHALERQAYAIAGSIFHQRRPDVVNESLTRAWKSMGKFRGESKFSTWFHRIVVNVCKQHGAKETARGKREVELSATVLAGLYANFAEATTTTPFTVVYAILTRAERDFLCDKLASPPLSDAEVATKWGLSTSGVRGRWMRLKRKIKAAL